MLKHWFVTCPRGLEGLLVDELNSLGIANTRETVAGVEFRDELKAAYEVCLWSRLANRVLLPLCTFVVDSADDLYAGARGFDWASQFAVGATIAIDFVGTGSGIDNTQFGAQRVKDGVVDFFRECTGDRPNVDIRAPDIRINARFARGKVTLSLDFSGDSLHRRGYRQVNTSAPLKENLAAALLTRAGWPGAEYRALVDPMCGSGTLLIEGAMMAADIAPGLSRARNGFDRWLGHQQVLWQALLAQALLRREQGLAKALPPILGYDQDATAVRAAEANIVNAQLAQYISVTQQAVVNLRNPLPTGQRGLLLTNPPYGARLGDEAGLRPLYRGLGEVLKSQFAGWRAAVFSGNDRLCFELGLRSHKQYKLFNGAIPARLLLIEVFADQQGESTRENGAIGDGRQSTGIATGRSLAAQENPQVLSAGAQMLANRLRKNQRKLQSWLQKSQLECYRIYDADLPEYAAVIDCYGEAVHVQEYAPPASIDPIKARQRMAEVEQAVMAVLQPASNQLFVKQRVRQRGDQQYQRADVRSRTGVFTVVENDLRFEVNLAEYLDSGLFLDHRPVRQLLGRLCAGKRLLNLFCYTGSATVYAARGGAVESLSLDLSNTYLDWAKRNFVLNGVDQACHRVKRADCLDWLAKGGDGGLYEVIFLDPPTFSNSKKMTDMLDIQRDHEKLVRQSLSLLAAGGQLVFSTNLRRFKLADAIVADFAVEDISARTIDRDFAGSTQIHQCWIIRPKGRQSTL
tara:strand:- start:3518 stop:5749 length:2232 start_codon:yes stop_codon:yes gene_type:complete